MVSFGTGMAAGLWGDLALLRCDGESGTKREGELDPDEWYASEGEAGA